MCIRDSTWINAFSFWLVQIPLAWTLAMAAGWGAEGVYWSIFIGDLTMGIIGTYLFMRGGWKRRSL